MSNPELLPRDTGLRFWAATRYGLKPPQCRRPHSSALRDCEERMADCLFCKIVAGEIPAQVVKRSPDVLAFRDVDPKAPTHVLVIPTRHVASVGAVTGADGERLLGQTLAFAAALARELGLERDGYRIVTNTGKNAGQSVDHLHLHVLGGRKLGWPPG